jgi:hypothetical protein
VACAGLSRAFVGSYFSFGRAAWLLVGGSCLNGGTFLEIGSDRFFDLMGVQAQHALDFEVDQRISW